MLQRLFFYSLFVVLVSFVGSALPVRAQVPQQRVAAQSTNQNTNQIERPRSLWIPTNPTEFFTLWVAAFTLVLAASTVGLWIVTWLSGRAQSRDTRILQRAYVTVDGLGAVLNSVGMSRAELTIKNVGRLPAYEVEWFINYAMDSDGRRANFPIDTTVTPFYGKNILPPFTEMKRSKDCRLSAAEVQGFERTLTFYVWGEVRYLDGFGNRRFTRFCHRYPRGSGQARLNQPVIDVPAESMRYHLHGNDGD